MMNTCDYGEEYSPPGLDVTDQCCDLLEAARECLCRGQVDNAIAYIKIFRDDGDYLLIALESICAHLEDATETRVELLKGLNDEKKLLKEDELMYQETNSEYLDAMKDAKWQKDHLQWLKHEADQKHCKAERAFEENKIEREAVRVWYFIPIVGWIAWGVKNRSCDAKMAKEKEVMDEAREQTTNAEASRDVLDALLEEDERKLRDAKEKLRKCELKIAEHHQLTGDLKKAFSVALRAKIAVEGIIHLTENACGNVEELEQILDICLTRPALGKSGGTALKFEHTAMSWNEVKDMIRANGRLLNHPTLSIKI
ncbi:uncharacterized protein LOC135487161 [Lineus longissimus]|uniref:uncharacterized protein LOC135487161 n=1 Tax=Lineus longissimus TaxID=88925 RepID=UPI002B4CB10C